MPTRRPAGGVPLSARLPGLLLFVFAVVYGVAGTRIEYSFSSDPLGPRAFPVLLSAGLGLLSVWYALVPGGSDPWPRGGLLLKVAALLALCVLGAGTYTVLGFLASTFLMCTGVALLFRAGPLAALACGVGNAALWYAVFAWIFEIPLPRGTLFGG